MTSVSDGEPYAKPELLAALESMRVSEVGYWRGLDAVAFARPLGGAWSPADNVRHLRKTTAPVARALRLPRLVLWMMFGRATRPSSAYRALVTRYRATLAAGGTAGRFAPSSAPQPSDPGAWQQQVIGDYATAIDALVSALARWSERDLDRYQLPHPLLGKLTVREMILFTLYHHEHHRSGVVKRLLT